MKRKKHLWLVSNHQDSVCLCGYGQLTLGNSDPWAGHTCFHLPQSPHSCCPPTQGLWGLIITLALLFSLDSFFSILGSLQRGKTEDT